MVNSSDEQMRDAYREPRDGERPVPAESVLAYFPEAPRYRSSIAVYALFSPLFAFAGVAVVTGSAGLGAVALLGTAGWFYWKRRRYKTVPRAVFTMRDGMLVLSGAAFPLPRTLPLTELLDVYLDTKAIQRVQESAGPVPDLRFLNSTVGGEQDTARIALELENETYFLTEERVSHTDANDWFSKIRRFLRKHGWVPEDER